MSSASVIDRLRKRLEHGHLLSDDDMDRLRQWCLETTPFDPSQDSVRELSSGSMSRLQSARSTEHEKRARVASMRRMLQARLRVSFVSALAWACPVPIVQP